MCIGEEGHTPNPRLPSFLRMPASSPRSVVPRAHTGAGWRHWRSMLWCWRRG